MRNSEYLERFFRNLLLGENNELRNRYMVVNAIEEPAGVQMQQVDRTSNRTSSCHIACLVQRAVISEKSDGEDGVETQAYIFRKLHGCCRAFFGYCFQKCVRRCSKRTAVFLDLR